MLQVLFLPGFCFGFVEFFHLLRGEFVPLRLLFDVRQNIGRRGIYKKFGRSFMFSRKTNNQIITSSRYVNRGGACIT